MNLNILSIEGDKEQGMISIRSQAFYVIELFMHFFRKVDLDGSNKLVIYFSEKPENEKKYMRDEYFHVSWYYVDKDTIDKFSTLKDIEAGEFFLKIIVEVCKYIAVYNNREKKVIQMIERSANQVRENHFELSLLQKRLSKVSKNKQYKANVYRQINRLGERWYVIVEDKKSHMAVRYELMEQYATISKAQHFKNSYWDRNEFVITTNWPDEIVASIMIQ